MASTSRDRDTVHEYLEQRRTSTGRVAENEQHRSANKNFLLTFKFPCVEDEENKK